MQFKFLKVSIMADNLTDMYSAIEWYNRNKKYYKVYNSEATEIEHDFGKNTKMTLIFEEDVKSDVSLIEELGKLPYIEVCYEFETPSLLEVGKGSYINGQLDNYKAFEGDTLAEYVTYLEDEFKRYVVICNKCGTKNLCYGDNCSNCSNDLTVF